MCVCVCGHHINERHDLTTSEPKVNNDIDILLTSIETKVAHSVFDLTVLLFDL